MPGVWVFPGGGVDEADGDGGEPGSAPARPASWPRRPASRWTPPGWSPTRAGSRPGSCRSASTPSSSSPSPPHSPPKPDGSETVDAGWYSPRRALDLHESGEMGLVFPTIKHLESLLPYGSAAQALDAARRREVRPVEPEVVGEGADARRAPGRAPLAARPPARVGESRRDDRQPASLGPRALRPLRHHRVHDRRRARRQPITWPVTPYYTDGGPTIDVSTGLGYPKKADDAKAPERRPALLRPDRQRARAAAQVLVRAPPRWTTPTSPRTGSATGASQRQAALDQGHAPSEAGPGDVQLVLHADLRPRAGPARLHLARGDVTAEPELHDAHPEEVRSGHSEEPPEDHGAPQGRSHGTTGSTSSRAAGRPW